MWKHADIPKWDVSPQIDPSASKPYYTMSIWHVEACRHTQMGCIVPIKPSATEPSYTMSGWHVEACRHTQMGYIVPIKPSTTEPSYTMFCSTGFDWDNTSHLGMSTCFHMSNGHGVVGLWSTGINLGGYISFGYVCMLPHVKQTWCSRAMMCWVSLGEIHLIIDPSASEPYYTMSVWHVEACRHAQMRCIPPNWSQCFIALLHHICLTCGSMQTYWNEMYPH